MTTERVAQLAWLPQAWPLVLGFTVLAVPTMLLLASQDWTREAGAQGPIILITAAWLLWRQTTNFQREAIAGSGVVTAIVLAFSLLSYLAGQVFDLITFQALGLYGVWLAMMYAEFGAPIMRKHWFVLLYPAFLVPPPHWWMDSLTAPLKRFVSLAATSALQVFDFPVAHQGVTIFVGQYQLLVEDACSGMNSILGLIAIGLFYIYLLRRSSAPYAAILTAVIIPIAIFANIIRVIVLILLTYYFGDAVAQGFLHFTTGIFLFAVALALVFAFDGLLARILISSRRLA